MSFLCMRSNDEFSKLWSTILEVAEKNDISLEIPCIGLFIIILFIFI